MALPVLRRSLSGSGFFSSIRASSRVLKTPQLVPGDVQKYEGNPLFEEDKPWEKRFDNLYANVTYDEEEEI